jgi:hypothetical protein
MLPVGAVPLLPPAFAAPLGELRDVPHADALPHGRLVTDAHAEELDGPRSARARVVAVGVTTASASRGRHGRRQHAIACHGHERLEHCADGAEAAGAAAAPAASHLHLAERAAELQRRAPALEDRARRCMACTPRSRRPSCTDQLSANYVLLRIW